MALRLSLSSTLLALKSSSRLMSLNDAKEHPRLAAELVEVGVDDAALLEDGVQVLGDAQAADGGRRFHPLGLDHRDSDHIPVFPAPRPEVACVDLADVGADADADLEQGVQGGPEIAVGAQGADDVEGLLQVIAHLGRRLLVEEPVVGLVEQPAHALHLDAGLEQPPGDRPLGFLRVQAARRAVGEAAELEHQAVAFDLVQVAAVAAQHPVEGREQAVEDHLVLGRAQELGDEGVVGDVHEADADHGLDRALRDLSQLEDRFDELPGEIVVLDLAPQFLFGGRRGTGSGRCVVHS